MLSRRFILLAGLFALTAFGAYAQKAIQDRHYNMNTYDDNNCYSYGYDLTIPHLPIAAPAPGTVVKNITVTLNDSIEMIAKKCYSYIAGVPAPDFKFKTGTCNPMAMHPDITQAAMQYRAWRGDTNFLSMSVTVDISANGNGAGSTSLNYYLNVDFKNNHFVPVDSLFSPMSKDEILKFLETTCDSLQNSLYENVSPEDDLRLDGFNMDDKSLVAHYSTADPSSHDRIPYEILFPLPKISKFFNKKYSAIH